jgi:transposase
MVLPESGINESFIDGIDLDNKASVKELLLHLVRRLKQTEERLEQANKKLAFYENPHTPPSQQRLKKTERKESNKRRGAPPGHRGASRLAPEPDEIRFIEADECEKCGSKDLEVLRVSEKTIEDLPEVLPLKVTTFRREKLKCKGCGHVFTAKDPDCPVVGRLGVNLMVLVLMLKFLPRSVLRCTVGLLQHLYKVNISAKTANSILERVAEGADKDYQALIQRVRKSKVVYADETSMSVMGKKWWIWIFRTPTDVAVVIRNSRGSKVPLEILGGGFRKVLVRDGWKPYNSLKRALVQRCWAHLLREAKELNHLEAGKHLYENLCQIFKEIKEFNEGNPSDEERRSKYEELSERMRKLLSYYGRNKKLKKATNYARNGGRYWFTCVLIPGVEPTNNLAEQAIREHVLIRKIIGAIRSVKGAKTYETLASLIATWKLRNMNIADSLKELITENVCLTER